MLKAVIDVIGFKVYFKVKTRAEVDGTPSQIPAF